MFSLFGDIRDENISCFDSGNLLGKMNGLISTLFLLVVCSRSDRYIYINTDKSSLSEVESANDILKQCNAVLRLNSDLEKKFGNQQNEINELKRTIGESNMKMKILELTVINQEQDIQTLNSIRFERATGA